MLCLFFSNMCTLLFHITLIIMEYHVHLEWAERQLYAQSFLHMHIQMLQELLDLNQEGG
jgi:hypothetical protein